MAGEGPSPDSAVLQYLCWPHLAPVADTSSISVPSDVRGPGLPPAGSALLPEGTHRARLALSSASRSGHTGSAGGVGLIHNGKQHLQDDSEEVIKFMGGSDKDLR